MQKDIAGKDTWENFWSGTGIPRAVDPNWNHYNNTIELRMHEYMQNAFEGMDTQGKKLLEVGAARSTWLPYFAKEFGFHVTGLDYSEIGCDQARQILENEDVSGDIVLADMFDPPEEMIGAFDVVFTIGVIEHFSDTVGAIKALVKFLKPNGLIITQIPNMDGMMGTFQAILDREVYDLHVAFDRKRMRTAHEEAGVNVARCEYFIFTHFGVVNTHKLDTTTVSYKIKHFSHVQLMRLSKVVWLLERRFGNLPGNRVTSPYIMCTGRKMDTA